MTKHIEPTPEDFAAVDPPMDDSDEAVAHTYRLAQAQAMLRRFREVNGRDARTTDELTAWLVSQN